MRVVVTGGCGFVGAHLVRHLAANGHDVASLDIAAGSPLLDGVAVASRQVDISDWAATSAALAEARPEVVFHTAGLLSAAAEARPHAAYAANVTGTRNVLEAAALLGIGRVVLTSTIATYGPGVAASVDETTPQRPTTLYGSSKVFGELLGEWYAGRGALDFRAVRLPAVVGPGRGGGGASAYASLAVTEPDRGRPYAIPVAGATVIPLIHVGDAVRALLALAEVDRSDLPRWTYGVAGFSPSAEALAGAVRSVLPAAELDFRPDAATEAIVRTWPQRMDDGAARAEWGWQPAFDVDAAVRDTIATLAAHPAWP